MVNQNLKVGDVCLITGATSLTRNIGKSCVVVGFVYPGDSFTTPTGKPAHFWKEAKSHGVIVTGKGIVKTKYESQNELTCENWVIVEPRFLLKIDGHKEPEANSEKRKQKA